jgi:hypothetical protein
VSRADIAEETDMPALVSILILALAQTGPFPGAGRILGGQPQPTFPHPIATFPDCLEMAYDRSRGLLWGGDENRLYSTVWPSLWSLTPTIPHQLVNARVCMNSACVSNPGVPVTSSQFTGISIVPSRSGFNGRRTLLCSDFNGDLNRFDDHLVEIDPDIPTPVSGTANVLNVWYLDSGSCPASCRPSTNVDVPQNRADPVLGVESFDYVPGEPVSGRRFVFLISACMDFRTGSCSAQVPWGSLVALTPGCPGTWTRIGSLGTSVPVAPFQWGPRWLSFDPDTQSYWLVEAGNGRTPWPTPAPRFYEAKWNRVTMSFRILQSFPAWDGMTGGHAAIGGSNGPHWMAGPGQLSRSIFDVETGQVLPVLSVGPNRNLVLAAGTPDAGKPWIVAAAFSAITGFALDRERWVALDPDVLFALSLQDGFGNAGVLGPTGAAQFVLPALPTGTLLHFQGLLLGDPNENDRGIEKLSNPLVWLAP